MIGRATAALWAGPRRWIIRLWGVPDINTRQKWHAAWPHLARLPKHGICLLDAGCGEGTWSLELAARRPEWAVVGVDRELAPTERAERARRSLGLSNLTFARADFLEFRPARPFDAVLSIASAHYLVADGRGAQLFRACSGWLRPA